ncbi:TRAP transporter small permease subunit [Orrella marina]|uniref:TRAP transporter small permease protein n=1 Tax=Orrella marina TaxID=2163011 RepID=A0A2R4XNQ6_9BURK|nr:TRAP transporter small permease [Orrella marina]AWB35443.1 TRAP transporter small permease [Orrella marina]
MQTHHVTQSSDGPPALVGADRWLSKLEDFFALLASLCIFALMILGIWQVLGRQLFNAPISGYIDLVELSMATFAFMAVAYCQRLGGHVRMDLFVRMAKGRLRWVMELITTVLPLLLIAVLIYYSWEHFVRAYDSGDSTIDMEYPVWPSKLLVPLSFSLLFLRLLIETFGYWRLILHPDATPVAVPQILTEEEIARKEIEDSKGGA